MLAVLSPSLNMMMVSFSIFANLHTTAHNAIQNGLVPIIDFQLHIAEEAMILLFYTLAVQLMSQISHDFPSGKESMREKKPFAFSKSDSSCR